MPRNANIPLFLWIATATLAHLIWGGGAEGVASFVEEKGHLQDFAHSVRLHVTQSNRTIEISFLEELTKDITPAHPNSSAGTDNPTEAEESEAEPEARSTPTDSPPPQTNKAVESQASVKPKPTASADSETKPPSKPKEKKRAIAAEPAQLAPLRKISRIAVQQHVKDKTQPDNPDAEFLGEHANRTTDQTQAQITSTDQNDAQPSAGTNHSGPSDAPGNANITDVAQSSTKEGDLDEAPSPSNDSSDGKTAQRAQAALPARSGAEASAGIQAQQKASQAQSASDGQSQRSAQSSSVFAPELAEAVTSPWYMRSPAEAQRSQQARRAKAQRKARRGVTGNSRSHNLGTLGATPGGLNPNLQTQQALASIGQEQLKEERLADGARRRSKHRGSFRAQGLERWRSAIENYVPGVKPGNQTNLNTAHSPFATYLNRIHNRLHPQFAHRVLQQLDQLPSEHPMNRFDLRTDIEIVLSAQDGRIVRLGVLSSSGVTAFDIEPLESVTRAAPFGSPPREIVSPDGNVYLHWGFMRDPRYACSTFAARPFILKASPQPAPAPPQPPTPQPPAPQRERHGQLRQQTTEQDG